VTYSSIAAMAKSVSLQVRVAACAATQPNIPMGLPAGAWAQGNMLTICAQPGWADKWDQAPLYNPDGTKTDTGARDDVITDAMILEAVTAVIDAQNAAAAQAQQPAAGQPA
jgi:hypothetical protein